MLKIVLTLMAVLTVLGIVLGTTPVVQAGTTAQAACVETYTVVAGDTLGAIALRYLGAIEAYPQIVTATNEAAKTDTSFTNIANPNIIEIGWKLCIPARSATGTTTTSAGNTTPAATGVISPTAVVSPTVTVAAPPAAAPAALTAAQLGNATYQVSDAPGGDVVLVNGKAEEEVAPGSASKYTAQLGEQIANGTLSGKPYAGDILITSGGGSGTFYYVGAVPNNNGQPGSGVTALLGDRITVQTVSFVNNALQVAILERKPDEPFTAAPSVPVTKSYILDAAGKLVEGTAAATTPSTAPIPTPGSPEGTYLSTQPAADAVALLWQLFLGPNSNASWLSNYVGRGTSNATGTWTMTSADTMLVELIQRDGQNINEKFTFQIQGNTLVATQYNQSLYGDSGITFYKSDAQVTGTITYLPKIALPNDAVYEAYLVDVTDASTPKYISGISNRTNGDQVPLPFQLPYTTSQITPTGSYVVQAYISTGDQLLFRNSNGVAVITNGAPTSNVEVLVEQPAP